VLRRTRTSIASCAVAFAAALAPAAGAAVPGDFIGIDSADTYATAFNNDQLALTSNLSAQAAVGIKIHRQAFSWQEIERRPGNYDFAVTDRYMRGLAAHGQKVLPVLFDCPPFRARKRDRPSLFNPPKRAADLGAYGAALIRRYGPKGTFWRGLPATQRKRSAIRSWQIWNEPNLRQYWGGKPDAKQYAAMLKTVYKVMKRADRKAEIVAAGMPESEIRGAVPLKSYVSAFYRAGAKSAFDTFAFNAYAKNTRDLQMKLANVRGYLRQAGDSAPIWITEIGWADGGSDRSVFIKTPKGQAKEIKNAIALIGKQRKRLKLRGFVYYQWRDAPPFNAGEDKWGLHAGLLRINGAEKPAFKAFKLAVAKL
jgi:Glycosyl hydrolase catalytic core